MFNLYNIKERLCGIRPHYSDGKYALHKPLLLLYVLGRYYNDSTRMIPFRDIDIGLIYLFERYYPEAIDYSNTHYPFGKLENDGIWEIENSSQLLRTSVGHLSKKDLNPSSL